MGLLFDEEEESGSKPLAKAFFDKIHADGWGKKHSKFCIVEEMFISKSGDWLVLKSHNCDGLLHIESRAAKSLISSVCDFVGGEEVEGFVKGKGLRFIPSQNKAGFDLARDAQVIGNWSTGGLKPGTTFAYFFRDDAIKNQLEGKPFIIDLSLTPTETHTEGEEDNRAREEETKTTKKKGSTKKPKASE